MRLSADGADGSDDIAIMRQAIERARGYGDDAVQLVRLCAYIKIMRREQGQSNGLPTRCRSGQASNNGDSDGRTDERTTGQVLDHFQSCLKSGGKLGNRAKSDYGAGI